MNTFVNNSGRGPSSGLWGDCPWEEILLDPNRGWAIHDDFVDGVAFTVPTTEGNFGRYKGFTSSGGVLGRAGIAGGGCLFYDATSNESASIAQVETPFQLSRSHGKFWFECRIKTSTIADNTHNIFVGLCESYTLVAATIIDGSEAITDQNLVGFFRVATDGDYFDTVYKANGVTAATVQADAVNIAADTWVKLGMKFDPQDSAGQYLLSFYANGVRLANTYTITATAGNPFPNDVTMGLLASHTGMTSAGTNTLDWWRAAQLAV